MTQMLSSTDLRTRRCEDCKPGTPSLSGQQIEQLLQAVPGWVLQDNAIERVFKFKNYYETMAFVNAVAWIAHLENHHPDLTVTYNTCKVRYSTHSVGGLSNNDFICAAKVDWILRLE